MRRKDILSSFHGIKTMNDKEVNYKYKIPVCLNPDYFHKVYRQICWKMASMSIMRYKIIKSLLEC